MYLHDILSFHNKLKTNPRYLNHHANRRCDDLIEVLLTIEEDLFHDRMRKEVILTPADATLKVDGTDRHRNGVNIPDSNVTVSYSVLNTCTCIYMFIKIIPKVIELHTSIIKEDRLCIALLDRLLCVV